MATTHDPHLSDRLADYVEAIFNIVREKKAARAKDISDRLEVGRSSVTSALQALAERGLVNYAPYDVITLTEKGESVARQIVRRHEVLRDFFVNVLAIEAYEADAAASKMEHAIPEAVLERFVEFAEFVERCPRGGSKWIEGFGYYCDTHQGTGNCSECIEVVLQDIQHQEDAKAAGQYFNRAVTELASGEKGVLVELPESSKAARILSDTGATAGSIIVMERNETDVDSIDIKVKGYHLTLSKEDAGSLVVEPLVRLGWQKE
jgi:DtxR family Mn-dependent transcriptional regulator